MSFHAFSGKGESFLLKEPDRTVLVDAGHLSTGAVLTAEIDSAEPGVGRISVAICTHEDADHAAGYPEFLDGWYGSNRQVDELWLPAVWAPALADLAHKGDGARLKILRGAYQLLSNEFRPEDLGEAIFDFRAGDTGERVQEDVGFYDNEIRRACFKPVQADAEPVIPVWKFGRVRPYEGIRTKIREYEDRILWRGSFILLHETNPASIERVRHWLGLAAGFLRTAERIQAIADAAVRHRIPVRWFDYASFKRTRVASGGDRDQLVPVNSVEVAFTPASGPLSAAQLVSILRLSQQNVQSLVFLRPATDDSPATLFTADSPLKDGASFPAPSDLPQPVGDRFLVTAPHHGSAANDTAYGVLDVWLQSKRSDESLFVRNSSARSIGHYLKTPRHQCVGCAGRRITLQSDGDRWEWPFSQPCCT